MWETEALRSSTATAPFRGASSSDPGEGWLTLRATVAATGIPISTLRKWVRKDAIPSFINETEDGPIRMLWLEGVEERAEELGRAIERPHSVPEPNPPTNGDVEIDLADEPDMTEPEPHEEPTPAPEPAPTPEPPPGTMVVPIEAWDKMLMQLGNLHEAGQQLAEARERAGKAETEARFLRERLAELREEKTPSTPVAAPAAEAAPVAEAAPLGEAGPVVEAAPSRRVSIEVEDGTEEPGDVLEPLDEYDADEDESVEEDSARRLADLSNYSMAVVKHLYGTWRDRPRR